ncbi:MAG: phosphoribosylanthranilate isomerase, partial [Thermoanaerobaculia bacterium]|nr:phosphoribosylanthranilate isomerase [Thermoanaerobaculia bacterium]
MTKIKICGITDEADALFCAEAGADFLGFIFVPSSPRHIEPEKAGEIAKRLRENANAPKIVGVFRDASVDYIREISNVVYLDIVQLHGSE